MDAVLRIQSAVDSSPTLRNKKDLIMGFVQRVSVSGEIDDEWQTFVNAQRTAELDAIIEGEGLKPEETKAFIETPSATASYRPPEPPSRRSCLLPRASLRVVATVRRSSACSLVSACSSSVSSG
jgi:type I site-specific restriction-modification system R (restriction) subunit